MGRNPKGYGLTLTIISGLLRLCRIRAICLSALLINWKMVTTD